MSEPIIEDEQIRILIPLSDEVNTVIVSHPNWRIRITRFAINSEPTVSTNAFRWDIQSSWYSECFSLLNLISRDISSAPRHNR